jgi:hypothetical protein
MSPLHLPRHACRAALVLLLLTACAQQPIRKYVPPQSGPTARLLMRSTLEAGERYGVFLMESDNDCKDMRIVAAGAPQRDPAAVAISASGVRTLDIYVRKSDRDACRVRWSFYPKPGRQYLVSTKSTPTGCSAMIYDATDVDAMKPEATLLRRDVPGNVCVPLASSKTLAQLAGQRDQGSSSAAAPRAAQLPSGVSDDDLKALTGAH